ncbi:MAG: hypothetical protein QOD29_5015, partial [Alphaproteobacteria bacterium]|nr:hypothetical protein [Alphaproteobacteria bacterium]
IHAGLNNKGGFPERVSKYLGKKYGYSQEAGANAGSRMADVLRMLASLLKEQRQARSVFKTCHRAARWRLVRIDQQASRTSHAREGR